MLYIATEKAHVPKHQLSHTEIFLYIQDDKGRFSPNDDGFISDGGYSSIATWP